jgi:nitrogen fixation NifU-like protein
MSDLRELYQEMILDHSKAPRNRRAVADAECRSAGHNPLCGDKVTITLRTRDGKIDDIGFEGNGCAISMASASMMTEVLRGKTLFEAEEIFRRFHKLVTGSALPPADELERLGKLRVFSGVREFPVRIKCATLAWHTLLAALEQRGGAVSTE